MKNKELINTRMDFKEAIALSCTHIKSCATSHLHRAPKHAIICLTGNIWGRVFNDSPHLHQKETAVEHGICFEQRFLNSQNAPLKTVSSEQFQWHHIIFQQIRYNLSLHKKALCRSGVLLFIRQCTVFVISGHIPCFGINGDNGVIFHLGFFAYQYACKFVLLCVHSDTILK